MGRMFRIITESGRNDSLRSDYDSGVGAGSLAVEEVPFVEVGGPDGLVTSMPIREKVSARPPVPRMVPDSDPVPLPTQTAPPESATSADPTDSASPSMLSVSFHQFPKTGLRLLPTEITDDLVVYHQPDHPVADEYRLVRDEMMREFDAAKPHTLLFTSPSPVSGTTTVLLNIAATLTHDLGAKVLVVDADFSRPSLARRLGVSESPGLAEVFGQTIPLTWALQPTSINKLHVLSAGDATPATLAAVANDFPRLVAQVHQWFDWVLVDGGVWTDGVAANALGSGCDGVYLVARQRDIDRAEFLTLRASVASTGGSLKGYVTTRI